jgi:hypothetical protein
MITCCKNENISLKRKLLQIDNVLKKNKTLTIRGSITEIEQQLKIHKKEKQENIAKRTKIYNELILYQTYLENNNKKINRLNQLTEMEEDIQFYTQYANINTNTHQDKSFFHLLDNLPVELQRCISEYLTYDTRCALLESKYKPLNLIKKMNAKTIKKIIYIIFNYHIYQYYDTSIKLNMNSEYFIFYETYSRPLKRNVTDEKTFLSFLLIHIRYDNPQILYELYKYIILITIVIEKYKNKK